MESPRRTSFDRAKGQSGGPMSPDDTESRLEILAQERAALRNEVSQLRRSLEAIQEQHKQEVSTMQDQLEEMTGEKEHAETQYRNLLGKVNTIRSQLGERLKADAVGSIFVPA